MTDQPKKPEKEWWIEISPEYDEPHARQNSYPETDGHMVHVIEYCVHEQALAEIERLKAQVYQANRGRTIDANEFKVSDEHLENLKLKALAESYRDKLAKVMKLIDEGKLVRDISNDHKPEQILSEARQAQSEGEK